MCERELMVGMNTQRIGKVAIGRMLLRSAYLRSKFQSSKHPERSGNRACAELRRNTPSDLLCAL